MFGLSIKIKYDIAYKAYFTFISLLASAELSIELK